MQNLIVLLIFNSRHFKDNSIDEKYKNTNKQKTPAIGQNQLREFTYQTSKNSISF
jgi:hypothetical protein